MIPYIGVITPIKAGTAESFRWGSDHLLPKTAGVVRMENIYIITYHYNRYIIISCYIIIMYQSLYSAHDS